MYKRKGYIMEDPEKFYINGICEITIMEPDHIYGMFPLAHEYTIKSYSDISSWFVETVVPTLEELYYGDTGNHKEYQDWYLYITNPVAYMAFAYADSMFDNLESVMEQLEIEEREKALNDLIKHSNDN